MRLASIRFTALVALVTVLAAGRPVPAAAQTINADSAAAIKAAFIADLDTVRGKFIGLAEAFPQDKYTWRPMEGVRSVAEVLMLAAMEGYSFIPSGFGGKPAALGDREAMAKLRTLTDKAQIIEHLNKGFAHAKAELQAADPASLVGTRQLMGQTLNTPQVAMFIGGDLHEHLGQMIAYARMNRIVPPWSK